MCGIVGAVSLKQPGIEVNRAKPMLDKIAHRGPDDVGYLFFHTGVRHRQKVSFYHNLTDEQFKQNKPFLPSIDHSEVQRELLSHDWDIYFGHRRLSIIDISVNAHQPMSDLARKVWLVYNGEIYNFKELRTQLQRFGHTFTTQSDTEVLIYAYITWGADVVKHLNGMFSFAIYDDNKKKVYLARDRYGIKPLYYTLTANQTLLFASESKALLSYLGDKPNIDTCALAEYFTFQNIFSNRTFYQDIQLLEPGHYLEVDLQKAPILVLKQYWDFDFKEPVYKADEREYSEELDRLFNQAVERQLVGDVEVGSFLSGGMDSGSITAIASNKMSEAGEFDGVNNSLFTARDSHGLTFPHSLKTFTVGFDLNSVSGMELAFDERAKAEYMSYLFKTEHYEMVLKAGDMERCLPSFSYYLEEPRVGQSYPNFYASKLASRFVKVCLAGTGGDELFGGYPWRYYRAVNNKNFDDYAEKYYVFWQRLLKDKDFATFFAPIYDDIKHIDTREVFKAVFKNSQLPQSPEDYVNHSLYFEAKTFLHGLLVVEDKLSMAHSLETRVPFLDNDLVDFALRLPVKYKLGNLDKVMQLDENDLGDKSSEYFNKTRDGKILFRKVMEKYVPKDITKSVKQGFSSPDNSWFKGESIDYVRKILLDEKAQFYRYIDKKRVSDIVGSHISGEKNHRLFLWSLINFSQWCCDYE
ncbi:MAG: asparagine synthase (glutamine-hydrolyzing) [Francisellaceae bacterium]